MELNDLWVGDKLKVISTGEIVQFDSVINGLAKVKTSSGYKRVAASDLIDYTPEEKKEPLFFEEDKKTSKLHFNQVPKSIDLHIEKLSPTHVNALPERILSIQLEKLEAYLNNADNAGLKFLTIIHGKGTGVLKSETIHLLKGRANVLQWIEVHQGGAQEVWLK